MTNINGYILDGELTAKNAGSCRWGRCRKGGRDYFIKEFLSPVYPLNSAELSEKTLAKRKAHCDKFFLVKDRYYSTLYNCRTGNNIVVNKFFRHESRFYVVTDWVEDKSLGLGDISCLQADKKETLLRAILYSVAQFHKKGIIHSDLRPENLIVKPTKDGFCTAKIIDFDAGFLLGDQPTEIQGDFVYMAPETFLRIRDEKGTLDQKIDIFALGILFHQYWCGELPGFPSDYNYLFEALLDGARVKIDPAIPGNIRTVISKMLKVTPGERPDAAKLLSELAGDKTVKSPEDTGESGNSVAKTGGKSFYIPGDLD